MAKKKKAPKKKTAKKKPANSKAVKKKAVVKEKTAKNRANGTSVKQKASSKKKAEKKTVVELVVKRMPVRRHINPSEKAIVANQVVVRSGQGMSQLFFFDIIAPIVIENDSDDIKKEAAAQTHVDAHCVSRVVIPTDIVPSLIQALQSNLDNLGNPQAAVEAMGIDMESLQQAMVSAIGKAK